MNYPKIEPIPIKTKGKPWYQKIRIWLLETRKWKITEDYELYIPWLKITLKIPKGFITDGASIPKIFWTLLSPTGILLIPGLFHDFGYKYNCYMTSDNKIVNKNAGKAYFDKNFRKMGVWVNDISSIDKIAWFALKIGGFGPWYNNRKEDKESMKELEIFLKM